MTQNGLLAGRRVASGAVVALLLVAGVCGIAPAGAATVPAGVSPLDADQAFVASAYQDFLGRSPRGSEWNSTVEEDLTTPAGRGVVVGVLANSPEWVTSTVQDLYLKTLGRDGDQVGVDYWVRMLRTKRLSVATVAASMYSSQEYFEGFGGSNVRTWVVDLYSKILLRNGSDDPKGVSYWVSKTAKVGRTNVAYAFFQTDESRHARVKGLYESLLGRAPEKSGWDYWSKVIISKGDLVLAMSLAASDEYYNRAAIRYANAGPGTWVPLGVGAGDVLYGSIVLGSSAPTGGQVVCTTPCQHPTLLAGLAGYGQGQVVGMTSSGIIVGGAYDTNDNFAGLVWTDAAATPTLLATPSGTNNVSVAGVSDSGIVAGNADDQLGGTTPYYWSSSLAQPVALAVPAGSFAVIVTGVSPTGAIFGTSVSGNGGPDDVTFSGIVWSTPDAQPTIVTSPAGGNFLQITAMSASGELVGIGATDSGTSRGLAWSSASAAPVTLAPPSGFSSAFPYGISSAGQILGGVFVSSDENFDRPTPAIWQSSGVPPTTLPLPAGYSGGIAIGVLSTGQIMGYGIDAADDGHGLVWPTASTAPTVLPDMS